MAIELVEFKNLIAPDVLSCPDPILERELISTIIEFCQSTDILQREFEISVDTEDIDTEMQNCIDFDIAEYARDLYPVSILVIKIDGNSFKPFRRNVLNTLTDFESLKNSEQKYYWIPDYHTIRIFDFAGDEKRIYLNVSFKPLRSATEVDEVLFENWSDAIVTGTKWRILDMPGKEWTDFFSAEKYRLNYRRYLASAKAEAIRGGSSGQQTVNWKSFGELN